MIKSNAIRFSLLLLFAISFISRAQASDAYKTALIEKMWEQEDYTQACRIAKRLYDQYPLDVKSILYHGRCLLYQGDLNGAAIAYDKAEILDENSSIVNNYLANLHVSMNNFDIAKGYYDKAERFGNTKLTKAPTKTAKDHRFSFLMNLSTGYDDNVKYSADRSDLLDWYGNIETLKDGKPVEDFFFKEYLRLNHVYDPNIFSNFYYKNRGFIYNKNYTKYSEEDYLQLSLSSGPGYANSWFDIWIPFRYDYIATDYEHYLNIYAVEPEIRKRFKNGLFMRLWAYAAQKEYKQWSGSDNRVLSTKATLGFRKSRYYVEGSYRYNNVEKRDTGSRRIFIDRYYHSGKINAVWKASRTIEMGAGAEYRKTRYDDTLSSTLLETRVDTLRNINAYMTYTLNSSTGFMLKYDTFDNNTNYIPLNYKKNVIDISFYLYY